MIDRLAGLQPGPELAALLAAVDVAGLSAHQLILVAMALQRQLAHDEAALLRVFAELAARPEYQRCGAGDDVGTRHVHRAVEAAGDEVSLALRWTLTAGRIDADKARLIAERTRCLPDPELRRRVETVVLPVAAARTRWVLDQRLRREVIAADPAGAEARRELSAQQRRVGRPEPATPGGDDAMATMTLTGPAEDLTALWVATDAAARHARTGGDERTLDQLRFDLLTGLGWTALDSGHLGCCNPTCADTPDTTSDHEPRGPHDPNDPGGPVVLGRRRGRAATVHVTVPVSALRGDDQTPGELDGFGPVTAATARRVAADATLRRLLTDPTDGRLLEYGRTTYAPPADLAAHVVARDRTCRFPTCHRPATEAEIDHKTPWAHGGTTDPDNTWALHSGHHRAKTWHRFTVTTDPDGTTWWITPAGHRYPVDAETIGPVLTAPPAAPPPRPARTARVEAVPF